MNFIFIYKCNSISSICIYLYINSRMRSHCGSNMHVYPFPVALVVTARWPRPVCASGATWEGLENVGLAASAKGSKQSLHT